MLWAHQQSPVKPRLKKRAAYFVTLEALETRQLLSAGDSLATAIALGTLNGNSTLTQSTNSQQTHYDYKLQIATTSDIVIINSNAGYWDSLIYDANGNLQYDDTGECMASTSYSNDGRVITRLTPGTYYYDVYKYQAVSEISFSLNFSVSPIPGNSLSTAQDFGSLTGNVTREVWAHTNNLLEYYKFTNPDTALITLTPDSGNIGLYSDANGDGRAGPDEALMNPQNSATSTMLLPAGIYYIQASATYPHYGFSLSTSPAPADTAGDTFATARDVEIISGTFSCQESVGFLDPIDVYKLTIPSAVVLTATNSGANSKLIWDQNRNGKVDENELLNSSNNSEISATYLPAGTYYLSIPNGGSLYRPYTLTIHTTPAPIDPGDTLASALDIGSVSIPFTRSDFMSALDVADLYRFTVPATLDVTIKNDCGGVNNELIWDKDGDGQIDGVEIIATAGPGTTNYYTSPSMTKRLVAGTYYLHVTYLDTRQYFDTNMDYTITITSAIPILFAFKTWNQEGYIGNGINYNNYTPLDPVTNQRSLVGCSPIAAAQVMDYWDFPSSLTLNSNDAYISQSSGSSTINIAGDASRLQFPTFSTLNNALSTINYADPSDLAYLAFALGIVVQADFSSEGTSSYFGAADFRRLGFVSAQDSSNWDTVKPTVITNLMAGQPVMLDVDVANDSVTPGHAFILDGYNPANGTFHCNFGWGGAYDGWFTPPSFNVNGTNYNHINGITYNIAPPVAAPANLKVSADSTPGHEQIYWDTTLLATGYQVWRSTSNDPATATNITPQNLTGTTFTDTSGRNYYYWVKAVNANGSSAFSSSLAVVPNYTPLVTNLYRDVLGRAPETAGLNNWLSALGNGTTNATLIAAGFTGSVEYRSNRINEVYRAILNRNPDQWGFNNWLGYLGTGHTLEEMKAGFYGSPEYRARHGGSNTTVATAYYHDILGRAPDADGLAHWVTLLNGGSTATQVAYAIMSSSYEGAGLIVRRCYTTYLHRDPDTAGYQSWVSQILHGTSEVTIITGFLGSPEYARRG